MNKKAFSLIELSIAILIIGILVVGVTQGSRLTSQFRLQNARNLTQRSPVASIENLAVWYEASSEKSFSEVNQADESLVDAWLDINPQSNKKIDASATLDDRPKYIASCINSIPCVRFDGVDDSLVFDGSFIAHSNYSVFVVESRDITVLYNLFIGGVANAESLNLGYISLDGDNYILDIHGAESSSGRGNFYNVNMSALQGDSAQASVHSFFFDAGEGNDPSDSFYLFNGASTVKGLGDTDVFSPISSWAGSNIGYSGITPGRFYSGDISEIIMFSRKLRKEEISEVIEYLGKKYNIDVVQN